MKKQGISLLVILLMLITIPTPLHADEYRVELGDNLWKIAQDYETSITRLYTLNALDSDLIYPDQVLRLEEEELIHQIERGDTLSALAIKYQVSVLDLMNWNKLESDLIIAGNALVIYPNAEAVDHADEQELSSPVSAPTQVEPSQSSKRSEPSREKTDQKTLAMTATAYTAECEGCTGITYTGLNLNENRQMKVVAVDPNVIPLGTRVYVEGYGEAIAGDIGGAIKGNKIDIHVPTKTEAYNWGVREVDVTILE